MKEHNVAQVFHSPSIIMARLAGVFLPQHVSRHRRHNPLDHWLEWVAFEERKRVGWFAFMMDTANAAMFRHYHIVHCFAVHLDWPASDAAWEAREPYEWNRAHRSSPRLPSFRATVRNTIARGAVAPTSEFGLWIMLHGLLSISSTLLWRDLGDLRMFPEVRVTHWKNSLRRAFRVVGDTLNTRIARLREAHEMPLDLHIYGTGIPFSHLGSILVLTDTESMRIFAGERSIAGRTISPGEWAGANAYVHTWARSVDGANSFMTAIDLLESVFRWAHERRHPTVASIIPWCCYIAALLVWTYATVHEGPDETSSLQPYILHLGGGEAKIEPSLARRDAQDYLARMAHVRALDLHRVPNKNKCAGVVAYSAHIALMLGRSTMDDNRGVLMRLLMPSTAT